MKRTILTAILGAATMAVLVVPGIASAARPIKTAPAPQIILNATDPHLGDTVTFTTIYPDTAKNPLVGVVCSQNGAPVFSAAVPVGQSIKLGGSSSQWTATGGAATCIATLYSWDFRPYQTFVQYAQMSFNAGTWR